MASINFPDSPSIGQTSSYPNGTIVTWDGTAWRTAGVGPIGPQGFVGTQGSTGPQGVTGNQGITGPQGITGNQGNSGPQGFQGPTGTAGVAGAQGPSGSTLPIVQSITNSPSSVVPTATNNMVIIASQSVGFTFSNPTGTWVEGQSLILRVKDNGVARSIGYDTNYRAVGVTRPTTTTVNKYTYIGILYNSIDTKWDIVAVSTEF